MIWRNKMKNVQAMKLKKKRETSIKMHGGLHHFKTENIDKNISRIEPSSFNMNFVDPKLENNLIPKYKRWVDENPKRHQIISF